MNPPPRSNPPPAHCVLGPPARAVGDRRDALARCWGTMLPPPLTSAPPALASAGARSPSPHQRRRSPRQPSPAPALSVSLPCCCWCGASTVIRNRPRWNHRVRQKPARQRADRHGGAGPRSPTSLPGWPHGRACRASPKPVQAASPFRNDSVFSVDKHRALRACTHAACMILSRLRQVHARALARAHATAAAAGPAAGKLVVEYW